MLHVYTVVKKTISSEGGPEICLFLKGLIKHFISPTIQLSNSNLYFTCSINILHIHIHIHTHTPHSSQRSTSQHNGNDPMTTIKDDKTLEQKTSKQQKWSNLHTRNQQTFPLVSTIKWNRTTKTCCTHISHTSESLLPSSNAAFSPKNLRNSDTRGC